MNYQSENDPMNKRIRVHAVACKGTRREDQADAMLWRARGLRDLKSPMLVGNNAYNFSQGPPPPNPPPPVGPTDWMVSVYDAPDPLYF